MRLHSSSPPIGFGDETTSPPLSQRIGPSALKLAFYPLIHCTVTFDIHRGQFSRVDLRQGCALRQMDNRLCVVKSFNPGARARASSSMTLLSVAFYGPKSSGVRLRTFWQHSPSHPLLHLCCTHFQVLRSPLAC